ncbi:hypothetical protein ONS96_013695 [Cadophora gregata f. sp. sojae]|nr:hypothetical protein ONS96_013695 [Cadophora gregata f. sp. sojae]
MPIKVSNCGRIWLTDNNGVYAKEIPIVDASLHLVEMQRAIVQAENRKSENELALRQRREEIEAKEKRIGEHLAQAKRRINYAENKLLEPNDPTEQFCSHEKATKTRLQGLEKAILKRQGLERAQIGEEQLLLERLRADLEKLFEVLKLEKECMDRDSAELADKERQYKEQSEQGNFAQDLTEIDIQKRKDKLREQQETLAWERLDFELMMNQRGEEARKKNAEILERDRITQETEARERENLRVVEAKSAQEDANRRQQEIWDMEFEKLQVRAEQLKQDEEKVAANLDNMAIVEKQSKEVNTSLTKITEEFTMFRKEARNRIDSLRAEHEAQDRAIQVELKSALEAAQEKSEELQILRTQLVEEDLRRSRNHRSTDTRRPPKGNDSRSTNSDIVKDAQSISVDKNQASRPTPNTTSSPAINDFVFISSKDSFRYRDHAMTRDSDVDDYLEDPDS